MENNTQLPVEYNPGVCSHKRPNGFTAWQMQSESSGSGPDFDEHVTICVCVLCGDFNIQTNRFSETFHVYVPEAIDAIVKQANFYNEEAKWERIDKAGETAYATKLHELHKVAIESDKQRKEANDELREAKKLLNEVFRKHESGLLPDRFIYEKIKKFLYGE